MRYTVIYVPDDGKPEAYGLFSTWEAADRAAERMERSLDDARDAGGGGVGMAWPAAVRPLREW